MKHERSEIRLLLGLLLIFSSVIGILHEHIFVGATPTQQPAPNNTQDNELEKIIPFIESQSIETIVAAWRDIPFKKVHSLLTTMIDTGMLNRDDLIVLISGLSTYFPEQPLKNELFSLLLEKPLFKQGLSPLYIVAKNIYAPQVLPALANWLASQISAKKLPSFAQDWYQNALKEAIDKQNLQVLQQLDSHGFPLSPTQLSELLWLAARTVKNSDLLMFLIHKGANIQHSHDGLTPLMRAVHGMNVAAVKILINAGAPVNTILVPEKGSALQQLEALQQKEENKAKFKQLLDIEDYLRGHAGKLVVE